MMFLTSTRRCAARSLSSATRRDARTTRVAAAAPPRLADKRHADAAAISALPECVAAATLREQITTNTLPRKRSTPTLDAAQTRTLLDAGLATFHLHVQCRVATFLGEGFYTIGPCGEETLGAVGLALQPGDGAALHYRHLATNVARALAAGASLEQLLLDRARGYCVSARDPATGGVHCAIGGGADDFLATSTLASHAPQAVGRALAVDFMRPRDRPATVEYCSLGDGSVNNAHFLAAANLAEYVAHRGGDCGVVFGIADNDSCISLPGHGWLPKFLEQRLGGAAIFRCDGTDAHAVYAASVSAVGRARTTRTPAVLVFDGVPRRFGHAATDRQRAYLDDAEIERRFRRDPLAELCADALDRGVLSLAELTERELYIAEATVAAFDAAAAEPKLNDRADLVRRVAAPLAPLSSNHLAWRASSEHPNETTGRKDVLRKHATRVIRETLDREKDAVYVGEDCVHGGYYLMTEGLHAAHPRRVRDFPPDETTLLGAAAGLAQRGFLPIVEMPYAKYLDCGADQFYEIAIHHWLSNGTRPNGMVIRLQGFDRGLFGGNFHTHNELRLPPGVDAVCFSNGADYVRGFRHAVRQARAGRVVMVVDPTYLLNLREAPWLTGYPADDEELGFDVCLRRSDDRPGDSRVACVSWGTGVVAAVRARDLFDFPIDVFETPGLAGCSDELAASLEGYDAVVFADPCKPTQCPSLATISALQSRGALPPRWRLASAVDTYNPLGRDLTFLSARDVADAAAAVVAGR